MKLRKRLSSIFSGIHKMGRVFGGKKMTRAEKETARTKVHIADMVKEQAILEDEYRRAKNSKTKKEFKEKRNDILIEEEMLIVQKSTKTTFPQFLKLHDRLRMKYQWYYRWHLNPFANKVHLGAAGTSLLVAIILITSSALTLSPKALYANQEPKLVVSEQNPEKTPCKFFFKSESGKCDQLWQKISDDEKGLRIRTKSGTEAGYQEILILGNQMSLFDGKKLVATAEIQPQEEVGGVWQNIEAKSETQNPNVNSSPNPQSSNEVTPAPTETPSIAPSETPTATPEAMINQFIKKAQAADTNNSITNNYITSESITKADKQDLRVESKAVLKNGVNLSTTLEARKSGQKQTFSLPANPNGRKQRIVLNVDLKNYDIKSDKIRNPNDNSSSNDQSSNETQYGEVILDTSDYKGETKIEEKAASDNISVIFGEAGTTGAIEIDPIFTVTTPASQISVDDGTRKWVFDESVVGKPKYFYHTSIGSGSDNIASTNGEVQTVGPNFAKCGTVSSVTQTLVENTPTRVVVRVQGAYTTNPTNVDNYYTIYPTGQAFFKYSATDDGACGWPKIAMHYLNASPQVQSHDTTNHAYVESDTSNNNYPGMAVVPYTSSEFFGASGWTNSVSAPSDWTASQLATHPANTYTGNMVIDFSNYRATTTTRDNEKNDYRTPATLANFDKGSASGDGYAEGEGAYTITADASGDAKFDFQKGSYTRYKPAFKIGSATRSEDAYLVKVGGTVKTKGIDYNLSKIDANTVIVQWLSDVSADLTDLEISGIAEGSWTVDGLTYTTRKKLTIDETKVDGNLTDFPVLVKLSNSNFDFSKSNSDGFDIRFTDSSGSTLLKYERERHDSGNSLAEYWVKIPTVSGTVNTDFFIYYRTTDTADGADPTNVWDANYKAVWHMNDLTTSSVKDSTTNGNDGTKIAANEPIEANGKIAKGQDNDGSNDYMTTSLDPSTELGQNLTVEAWAYPHVQENYHGVVGRHNGSSQGIIGFQYTTNNWTFAYGDGTSWKENKNITSLTLNDWTYLAGTIKGGAGGSINVYKNEAQVGSPTSVSTNISHTNAFDIGRAFDLTGRNFDGPLDEIRISDKVREPEWIKASYYSEYNTLLSFGGIEGGNRTWDGGGGADTNWSTCTNWSDDTCPTGSDNVIFGSTSTNNSTVDAGFAGSVNSMTVGTGYTGTITVNKDLTINGNFSLEQGTLDASDHTINVGGNWSRVGGTFTKGTSTINFNATSTGKTVLSGGQQFNNLTFNGSGGGWTLNDGLTVSNDFNVTNANTFNMGSSVHNFSGHITFAAGITTFSGGSSTIVMNGSNKDLYVGGTYYLSSVTVAENSRWTYYGWIAGTLTIKAGKTLTITAELNKSSGSTIIEDTATITGGSMKLYNSAIANFATTGTLSTPVIMYAQGDIIVPARTYGGSVSIYNYYGTGNYNATFGTGAGQTLNFSSNLVLGTNTTSYGMTIRADTYNPTVNVTGNIAMTANTGTPSITMGSGTWTVSGNVDFTNGTVTAGGSTLIMNGDGKTLVGAAQTLNYLQISNNITAQTSKTIVSGTLVVDNGKTLTLAYQYFDMAGGSTTTLNGTIQINNGCKFYLINTAGANLSSGGTFTYTGTGVIVFNPQSAGATIPARTYGAPVTVLDLAGNTSNLGTAPGQTINFQSNFTFGSNASTIVDASANNPTINIGGNISSGGGQLKMGSGTWTASGNVDFTNGTVAAGGLLKMDGNGKTLVGNNQILKNLQISNNITVQTSRLYLQAWDGNLTVDNGCIFTISGINLTIQYTTITLNGTIASNSGGFLDLGGGETASQRKPLGTSGTLSASVRFSGTDMTVTNRTYGGPVEFGYWWGAGTQNLTFGDGAGQTLTFQSNISVTDYGTGPINVDASIYNPTVNITGNITFSKIDTGTPGIKMGSGTWTVSGNVNFTNGTVTAGNSTLVMNGDNKTLTANSATLKNLTINPPGPTNTISFATTPYVSGILTVEAGKFFTGLNSNLHLLATATPNILGTVNGGWYMILWDAAGASLPTATGTFSIPVMFESSAADITVPCRTYGSQVIVQSNSAANHVATICSAPGQTISAGSNLQVSLTGAGNITADFSVNNPTVSSGTINFSKSGAGTPSIKLGSSTWTNNKGMDIRNGTFDAGNSTLIFNAITAQNVYTGGNSFNNLDFNGAGGNWTLQDDLTTTGYFKITAGTVNATNRTLNIAGDYNRAGGTFTTTGSTVNLNGTGASAVHGNTTFNNLTINSTNSAGGRTVTLDGSSTQTIGSMALTGAAGKALTLQSSNANNWTINPTAVTSSTYLAVSRSTNTGVAFCASYSTGSPTNVNWACSLGAACGPPAAPTGFTGTLDSPTQITWNWFDNADNEEKYQVQDGAGASVSGDLAISAASFIEGGLAANTQYTRKAVAINGFGNVDSNVISLFTSANDPGWMTATVLSDTSIRLSWTSGGVQSGFRVYRGGPAGVGTLVYSGVGTTFTDTGLAGSTTYTYYVYAINGDAVETTSSSSASATTTATPVAAPVTTPATTIIPTTATPGEDLTFGYGIFYIDLSWLKLPDIKLPTIHLPHLSFNLPSYHFPKLEWPGPSLKVAGFNLAGIALGDLSFDLTNVAFRVPDIKLPTIHLPHIPSKITFHWPEKIQSIQNVAWDFGDGVKATGQKAKHTYSQVGEYLAKLTITADDGTTKEITKKVTVAPQAPEITDIKAKGGDIEIVGKAYPGSAVYLTISSNPITVNTEANHEGDFSYLLEQPEQVLEPGPHQIAAASTVATADGAKIEGLKSKTYDFFVDYQGQMAVVKKQAEIWKWVAITAISLLLLAVFYGLYWRKIFKLEHQR